MANPAIRDASQEAAKRILAEVQRSGASPLSGKQFSKIIEEEVSTVVTPSQKRKVKPQ